MIDIYYMKQGGNPLNNFKLARRVLKQPWNKIDGK